MTTIVIDEAGQSKTSRSYDAAGEARRRMILRQQSCWHDWPLWMVSNDRAENVDPRSPGPAKRLHQTDCAIRIGFTPRQRPFWPEVPPSHRLNSFHLPEPAPADTFYAK